MQACAADIESVCGYEQDSLDPVQEKHARVIHCLLDYKEELVTPTCKNQVCRRSCPLHQSCNAQAEAAYILHVKELS